ncbi:hypothetical protein N7528_005048 [Penicillium herquei]|nr:hypothetical protein N7528_005048 [Penicillium herquei]
MPEDSKVPTFARFENNTNPSWWKDPSLRRNVFYMFGCMMCPFYLGYDQSLLTSLQAMSYWNAYFDSPSGDWLGIISAAILIPGIVMGFPGAWICNTWGRKYCILIGCVFIVAGGIWNGLCTTANQFLISRVIMGIGGALSKTGAPALLQEIAHPRLRSPVSSMYYGCYYIGSLMSGIMCIIGLSVHSDWSWRFPCLLAIFGPIVVALILLKAPESPRFLVKKGRNTEALTILAKYHANGDTSDPLVIWEYQEIERALEEEALSSKSSYLDLFKTKGNRKRLLVTLVMGMAVNWVGNGIVSYYLSPVLKSVGITETSKILAINAGLAAWNLIISEATGLYADKIGRRPMFLISTAGMIFSYCLVMGFTAGFKETGKSNLGVAAIPFLFLFFGFYDFAWTTMNYSYVAEIMPFGLRAKGLAIYLCVQQIGNAFNQFVNPIALDAISWKYYGVYIGVDVVLLVFIYFFFPETKKLSIEEVAMLFDYDDVKDARNHVAESFGNAKQAGSQLGLSPARCSKEFTEHVEVRNRVHKANDSEMGA